MSEENECNESKPSQGTPIWLKVIFFPFWLVWWIAKAMLKHAWDETKGDSMIYKIFFKK